MSDVDVEGDVARYSSFVIRKKQKNGRKLRDHWSIFVFFAFNEQRITSNEPRRLLAKNSHSSNHYFE